MFLKLEQLEKKMLKLDLRTDKNDVDIQRVFEALKKLLNPPQEIREPIGYKINKND
jgi:hypothetical protein